MPVSASDAPYTQHMPPSSLLHRLVALGTPVGKKNSQWRPGGPSHAKCKETGQTGAQRADLRRQAPEYDEYARIPSRRWHRIEHIAWSTSMRCCPARRAVPNVYLRTSAASDPIQVESESCIKSIRMLSIPAADMLKIACLGRREVGMSREEVAAGVAQGFKSAEGLVTSSLRGFGNRRGAALVAATNCRGHRSTGLPESVRGQVCSGANECAGDQLTGAGGPSRCGEAMDCDDSEDRVGGAGTETRRGEKRAREGGDGGEEGERDNRVMHCDGPAVVATRGALERTTHLRSVVAERSARTNFSRSR